MDPFLPAMVLTSLCIAATKVYRHLRPNDQQPLPVQAEHHDGHNLETADSTANGSQEASFSEATSSARTSSEESPGLCDEKDTDDNDSSPSPPLTALAPVTPPHSPPRMTRQYGFYKSIHHERSLLPTCHELLISDEQQVTQKDKDTNIPSQVITKSGNQAQHGSTTSSAAAQRYRAKKPWLIPQAATGKTAPSTRYPIRVAASHHPRQRHMISSSLKKISDDKTTTHSSTEGVPVFSIPSSFVSSSQATPPMTRQYAFCGPADTSSSTTSSSTTSSSATNATHNQERRTRLTSPELMPPPPPRPPRRHNRPLLRRQNAFFADTTPNHTMLVSKRKRHLMDENTPPPSNSRTVRQRLSTDNA